jgi:NOL1/NOP2/fmu family ribosome biogenesis protein
LRRRSGDVPDPSKRFLAYVTRAQRALLDRAVALVRPGGTILYVTCTFAPEENEAVVSDLLARAPVELEPLVLAVPHAPGLTCFEGVTYDARLEGAARIYPHHIDSGGLFMAKLRRLGNPSEADAEGGWPSVPRAFPGDQRTEAESAHVIGDALESVRARYDIERAFLDGRRWLLRGDTIWTHALRGWPLPAWEPGSWRAVSAGLRAVEIDASGRARATNELLRLASSSLRAHVEDVDAERMRRLLVGERDGGAESPVLGPVALRHAGDVVGRGRYTARGLTSEIPKARAQDLLRALTPVES